MYQLDVTDCDNYTHTHSYDSYELMAKAYWNFMILPLFKRVVVV